MPLSSRATLAASGLYISPTKKNGINQRSEIKTRPAKIPASRSRSLRGEAQGSGQGPCAGPPPPGARLAFSADTGPTRSDGVRQRGTKAQPNTPSYLTFKASKQGPTSVIATAVNGADEALPSASCSESSWDSFTQSLVDAASVPFTFLLVPQVIKNFQNLMAGNAQALAILSADAFFVSFLGNVMLMSYFVSKAERGAIVVQGLGVASNFAMLLQIYLAGFLSMSTFNFLLAVTTVAFAINISKVMGFMESKRMQPVWGFWQSTLGVIGLAVLPQVLWQTFTQSESILPGCIALAAGLLLNIAAGCSVLPASLVRFKAALGACTATLLFMLQPVAQLAQNFSNPSSLEGLSIVSCCLAMVGNSMMIPRALYTQDLIWFAGCSWGYMLMGWGQLLSLFLGVSPAGTRFLGAAPFVFATVLAFGYFAFVVVRNTQSLSLKSPLDSFRKLQWPQFTASSA